MGERSGLREALLAHIAPLRRYAYGLAGTRADAEDLLQTTLLRALEHEHDWRGEGRAYLYAIMTNLNRNRLRGLRRQPQLVPVEDDGLGLADETATDPLLRGALMRALATLQPDFRAVLLLVAVEGCSYLEVAGILDVPVGTVMSRLSRARRQLADLVDRPPSRAPHTVERR